MASYIKGLRSKLGIQWLVAHDCDNYTSNNPCVVDVSQDEFQDFYGDLISRLTAEEVPVKFKVLQSLFEHDKAGVAPLPETVEAFLANEEYQCCLPEVLSWAESRVDMKAYEVSP